MCRCPDGLWGQCFARCRREEMGIRNPGETDNQAETRGQKGLLQAKSRGKPTSPRSITRHPVCEMHSRRRVVSSSRRLPGRGKEFSSLDNEGCGSTLTLVCRKCCGDGLAEAYDRIVADRRSIYSPRDETATWAAHFTNKLAGPEDISGIRIVEEKRRKGDWLVGAHKRKRFTTAKFQMHTIRRAC